MSVVLETPDAAVPTFLLQFRGNIAATPDAATNSAKMLVGHNLVCGAMQEEWRMGGFLKLGGSLFADHAAGKA